MHEAKSLSLHSKSIAVLHPQAHRAGGAIKMMLLCASQYQELDFPTTFFSFSQGPHCFPDIQKNISDFHITTGWMKSLRLAWKLRSYSVIICGNPPMHRIAVLAKFFSFTFLFHPGFWAKTGKYRTRDTIIQNENISPDLDPPHPGLGLTTNENISPDLYTSPDLYQLPHIVWWHHHIPWYYAGKYQISLSKSGLDGGMGWKNKSGLLGIKRWIEKHLIIPFIDTHWVTSEYVGRALQDYCGRASTLVYPVLQEAFLVANPKSGLGLTTNETISPDLGAGSPDLYTSPDLNENTKKNTVMITHGRQTRGKGYATLFCVYENIKKSIPDLCFWVIGDGDQYAYYSHTYKGDPNVTFFGPCSTTQIIAHYTQADVAVFASRIDAFGMGALEAQALGVDTVVLDACGAKEAVVDGQAGHLVSDASGMESIICSLLGGDSTKGKVVMSTPGNVYLPFGLSHFSSFLRSFMRQTRP